MPVVLFTVFNLPDVFPRHPYMCLVIKLSWQTSCQQDHSGFAAVDWCASMIISVSIYISHYD